MITEAKRNEYLTKLLARLVEVTEDESTSDALNSTVAEVVEDKRAQDRLHETAQERTITCINTLLASLNTIIEQRPEIVLLTDQNKFDALLFDTEHHIRIMTELLATLEA